MAHGSIEWWTRVSAIAAVLALIPAYCAFQGGRPEPEAAIEVAEAQAASTCSRNNENLVLLRLDPVDPRQFAIRSLAQSVQSERNCSYDRLLVTLTRFAGGSPRISYVRDDGEIAREWVVFDTHWDGNALGVISPGERYVALIAQEAAPASLRDDGVLDSSRSEVILYDVAARTVLREPFWFEDCGPGDLFSNFSSLTIDGAGVISLSGSSVCASIGLRSDQGQRIGRAGYLNDFTVRIQVVNGRLSVVS